ncbi:MAG: trigger factor [Pseudomonadota bacterium]
MQVTETKSEGLSRGYRITVAAGTLAEKTNAKLETVRADFQMKGFRKGKAPMPLLKKMFGKSVFGEVVQETVEETVRSHLEQTGHRPAAQPDVQVANQTFDEGDDLQVDVTYDCLPEIPEVDFSTISLERKVVTVDDAQIDEALQKLAASSKSFDTKEGAAEDGDQVVIDFVGKLDGEAFEGGSAEDYPLELGSSSFIPGFEEQLVGASAGEEKTVEVTFPENYGAAQLAGKPAVFDVTVKEVRGPQPAPVDDTLAEKYGAADLDELRGQLGERIGEEFTGAARNLLKRRLLDALDEVVSFDLPPSMVEQEANTVAQQLWQEDNPGAAQQGDQAPEITVTDEHRALAERRVRLGLLLADVGTREGVQVTEQELGQAVMAQARQYPGQEQQFFDFVKSNRGALEQIRAPLFEDKVIDVILSRATVAEVSVDKDTLQAELEALDADDAAS